MKYIYGPIKSRRLGLSLGISLTPYKVCSFDCVYCQLGKTTEKSAERKEYVLEAEIINELGLWFQNNPEEATRLNYITFSGSGEPTLHTKIGQLISKIKQLYPVKVAVITNASLFHSAPLRQELRNADLLIPSLDAANQEVFNAIDRPEENIKVGDIIEGLIQFRKEFKGTLWLEVMLVKGINDQVSHIRELKEAVEKINPDKIQLNSPVRATCEQGILPVAAKKLEKFKEILGEKCEVV